MGINKLLDDLYWDELPERMKNITNNQGLATFSAVTINYYDLFDALTGQTFSKSLDLAFLRDPNLLPYLLNNMSSLKNFMITKIESLSQDYVTTLEYPRGGVNLKVRNERNLDVIFRLYKKLWLLDKPQELPELLQEIYN